VREETLDAPARVSMGQMMQLERPFP